jgi:hypothetical protein
MPKPLFAALSIVLLLAACGSGNRTWYNPFGWFGGSQEADLSLLDATMGTDKDRRPMVDQVLSLSVDQIPGGAIIRATGLPATQGYWAADLIEEPGEEGRLTYRFVIIPPLDQARVSTPPSREVTVATSVTDRDLEGIREIVVLGQRNARSTRR